MLFFFVEGGKLEKRRPLVARERTNKQLYSHGVPEPRIEPTTGERLTATSPMLPSL
jgi:hypothetical protein